MNVYRSLEEIRGRLRRPVVTVGSYDGVHVGHRRLLGTVKELAAGKEGESVVVTFSPHPRQVLHPEDRSLRLLNSLPEKILLLESVGIDHLFVIPFTQAFSRLSSYDFTRDYLLEGVGAKTLIVGYNHHFGHNREGDFGYLERLRQKYGFELYEIPHYGVDAGKVSSTTVRKLIEAGDLVMAEKYLGAPYFVSGAWNSETGELAPPEPAKLLPPDGRYSVEIRDAKDFLHAGKKERGVGAITVKGSKMILSAAGNVSPESGKDVLVRFRSVPQGISWAVPETGM